MLITKMSITAAIAKINKSGFNKLNKTSMGYMTMLSALPGTYMTLFGF